MKYTKHLSSAIYIFIIINCLLNNFLNAQTFTGYTAANSGLPNNNVNSVTIDKFGNKWIGAENYIVKYDGVNWTSWSLNITNANKQINCIAIDSLNNKWIGTSNGLYKFDGINFTHFTQSNSGLTNNFVYAVAADSNGNIWAGTLHGISRYNGLNWYVFDLINKFSSIAVEPKGQNAVWAIIEQRDNNAHVYKFLNNTMTDIPIYYPIQSGVLRTIAIDKQNNKWIGSEWRGLVKLDNENIFTDYMDSVILTNQSNIEISIAFDEFNNKWCGSGPIAFGMGTSLLKFTDTTWYYYQGFAPDAHITSITIDSSGNKWMALYGKGLWKMDCQMPATPTALQGSDTVYKGQMAVSFKIAHPNDALYYNWVLPNGFTGSSTSDSIIINIDSNAVSGVISVYGHNSCGNGLPLTFNVTVVASQVGINEETNLTTQISVYPNPATNELNIVNSGKDIVNYEIYNTLGESICKGSFTMKTTVQTANFTKGIYLLKLYNEKGSKFQKVVKQ